MPPRTRRRAPHGINAPVVGAPANAAEADGEMLDEIDTALVPHGQHEEMVSFAPLPLDRGEDEGLEEYLHRVTFDPEDMSMLYASLHDQQQTWMPSDHRELMARRFRSMDLASRRDEQNHLREPLPGSMEKPCMNGASCKAMRIPGVDRPAPCVQHPTQEARAALAMHGTPIPDSPCVMCKRYGIQYFSTNTDCEARHPDQAGGGNEMAIFHSHGNIVDVPGEYTTPQCWVSGETHTHGMLMPCAMHVLAWYRPERGPDGVLRFFQDGYEVPQPSDF